MDKNRLWVIGAVLVIGAIVVLGWLLGISPKLSEVSAHESERDSTLVQNAAYEAQIVTLKQQFEQITELKGDLATIQEAVPTAAEIPALIAELNSVAAESQVVLSGFTQNDAQAYDPTLLAVEVPAAAAPAAGATSTSTPAPTTAAGAAEVAANAATAGVAGANAVPTVDPRLTPTNFVAIPVSITVDGPYDNVLGFVSGLQHGRRLIMVTAVSTTVPTPAGSVTGTVTALVYVLLDPNAAAVPAG
ncbi:hypothetical protein JF66_19960 [Cryobacterium sp. MLB-32]|uniref:type 4a pilus biogenesis protein PilO n=1 Tax=Cryobacterium sp. MLB-32 TaxID=1529318 RepID=UPI0004E77DA2|nr:type 4a pilus biogenesis protein PilO [Cryobacterium sp. MLB-32]KFF58246.1 hypothetical protein JF66_19960 [Cryobacterium sp. MLB-32]